MTSANVTERWDHTAELLALIANANRDRKKKRSPFSSADFHPFRKRKRRGIPWTKENLGTIREAFVKMGVTVRKVRPGKRKKGGKK